MSRLSARPLILQPAFPTDAATLDAKIEGLGRDLQRVIAQEASQISYAATYTSQYELVIGGRGAQLYDVVADALRRFSLCSLPRKYCVGAKLICHISMYLDSVWVVVHGEGRQRLCALTKSMYDRPVARRWRRALAHAKWFVRVRAWRVAFDEVLYAPGSAGARRAATHFRECAEHEGEGGKAC